MSVSVDWCRFQGLGEVDTYASARDVYVPRRVPQRYPYSLTSRESECREWYRPIVARITDLLRLRDNWDSYGASAPSLSAAQAMLDVLNSVMSTKTPAPFIAPSPDGHFQAEWHIHGIDLEVEVMSPTKIEVFYVGPDGQWHETLSNDVERLVQAIDRIDNPGHQVP